MNAQSKTHTQTNPQQQRQLSVVPVPTPARPTLSEAAIQQQLVVLTKTMAALRARPMVRGFEKAEARLLQVAHLLESDGRALLDAGAPSPEARASFEVCVRSCVEGAERLFAAGDKT